MAAKYERSWNENEQVVWLSDTDPAIAEAPAREAGEFVNPVSRLFCRNVEGVPA